MSISSVSSGIHPYLRRHQSGQLSDVLKQWASTAMQGMMNRIKRTWNFENLHGIQPAFALLQQNMQGNRKQVHCHHGGKSQAIRPNSKLILAALIAAFLTTACSKGSSAPPPSSGLSVLAGENRVTVTWDTVPGVEYWLFYGPADSISTSNWTSIPGGSAIVNAVSPLVVTGLVNGVTYSFTLNGRTKGGPGGAGTPSVSAVPRIAGAVWIAGSPLSSNDLRAVMVGTVYVAAGAGGVMYWSSDGTAWTPINYVTSNNLYGAVYSGAYMAVGAGGTMLYSTDAVTWASEPTGTTNNLYAIASNIASLVVAVGANGTIILSADGKTWYAAANSGTTNDLHGVTYSTYNGGTWVAVGAGGTIVTSIDGTNWQPVTSNTTADLKGIAYGYRDVILGTTTFVAVGAAGTIVTSTDGAAWTLQTPLSTGALNAVAYGLQFVSVGENGAIFTSTNGTSWTAQSSNAAGNLYGTVHSATGYSVVGAGGTNLFSQ